VRREKSRAHLKLYTPSVLSTKSQHSQAETSAATIFLPVVEDLAREVELGCEGR
jgi:hypothetical protein